MGINRILLSTLLLASLLLLAAPDLQAQEPAAVEAAVDLQQDEALPPATAGEPEGTLIPWILIVTGIVMLASAGMLIHRHQE